VSGAPATDLWSRKAARSLVDFGLESDQFEGFVKDLEALPPGAPEEVTGDVAYLRGRLLERQLRPQAALVEYAKVSPRSRFWAQATYLSGVIETRRQQWKAAEGHFCKVADKRLTPRQAPLASEGDFFRVRDMARLALGRVAHEQYRFDDARYYYYLVPQDSASLPEALYEASTTRYEKKDYEGARELMDELRAKKEPNVYEDEAYVLDAFIDLATCNFASGDRKLQAFLKRYDPVRDTARKLAADPAAVRKFVEAVQTGKDPAAAGVGGDPAILRSLGALLRLDAGYGRASRRVA
jgi:hypothetical protein